MTNEQRELAARLRWASAASKVSAQNVNYQCSVTIADAEAAATTIEQLAARCGRLEEALRLAESARDYNGDMLNKSRLRCGRLEEALRKYGTHIGAFEADPPPHCMGSKVFGADCTCGFDAALAPAQDDAAKGGA